MHRKRSRAAPGGVTRPVPFPLHQLSVSGAAAFLASAFGHGAKKGWVALLLGQRQQAGEASFERIRNPVLGYREIRASTPIGCEAIVKRLQKMTYQSLVQSIPPLD